MISLEAGDPERVDLEAGRKLTRNQVLKTVFFTSQEMQISFKFNIGPCLIILPNLEIEMEKRRQSFLDQSIKTAVC